MSLYKSAVDWNTSAHGSLQKVSSSYSNHFHLSKISSFFLSDNMINISLSVFSYKGRSDQLKHSETFRIVRKTSERKDKSWRRIRDKRASDVQK